MMYWSWEGVWDGGWLWDWLAPLVCAVSGESDREAAIVRAIVRMDRGMGCFIWLIYVNRSFAVRIRTVVKPLII
jgi:hypothetical protein